MTLYNNGEVSGVVADDIVGEQREKFPNHKPWMMAFGPAFSDVHDENYRQARFEGSAGRKLVELISYPFKASYDLVDGHELDEREWRILVRQTPGDPTSMVERRADHVEPLILDGKTVVAEGYCKRNEIPYIS